MKITPKMKTTPNNKDDSRVGGYLKNKDNPKKEDNSPEIRTTLLIPNIKTAVS